ncbi:MAG: YdcF family protein, partial [Desulfobacterales bacterium]
MFLFKKLVAPFLLPPGLFILVLLLSGVFLIIWHRRKIGIFNLVVGLIFWIFCSAPFSNFLMRGLESEFQIPQPVKGDVIVLLGGGSIDKVPDFSGSGIPTDRMIGRIVTAVRLQKYLNIPIIVSSGKVHKNSSAGALIAKRFLIDLGVEEGKIVIEDKSRDTYENAKYTREICLRNGYKNPILVTSASHLKRS